MIDLHCHLLPGVDDGPANVAEALDFAREQVAAGVHTVVCTPHASHGYPRNTGEAITGWTQSLAGDLAAAGIPLELRPGAEVALARAIELDDPELQALHLGDSGWLLLEPPLATDVPRLGSLVHTLQARGHKILLAHPERCAAFHNDPPLLAELVQHGARVQVTASALAGDFGRTVSRLAKAMVDADLVHVVSSDAHDARRRPPGLAAPLKAAGFAWLTEWACEQVPSALLAGEELPPRPAQPRRGLFGRR
ncbi:MAG: hypothetical protein J7513_07885 [Solirubrobacteraceae bacterium]|nr:hypothetical protein [Solirubrobacteraceae bacterium]